VNEQFDVRLRLPAVPENVAVVRQALSGIAETLGMHSNLLADMKTAVTEACNNVVVHAYPDAEGTLEVDVRPDDSHLAVVVRDFGAGMQPSPVQPDKPTLGLGLPLIAALSSMFQIRGGLGQGIEVHMRFVAAYDDSEVEEVLASESSAPRSGAAASSSESGKPADITITPGPVMASVLGRVTAMLASRSDFPIDRLSDAVLVTDAISAHIGPLAPGSQASVALDGGEGALILRVGPLVEGGADQLLRQMELPGLEHSLERLANEVKVERDDEGPEAGAEYLELRLTT
jgi:serine/threonine-protein kinase RsbW